LNISLNFILIYFKKERYLFKMFNTAVNKKHVRKIHNLTFIKKKIFARLIFMQIDGFSDLTITKD